MSKPLKPRRGTTAEQNAFVGEAYEITYDTDRNTIVCRDGLTAGGFPLQRADLQAAKDAEQDESLAALRALIAEEVAKAMTAAATAQSSADAKLPLVGGELSGILSFLRGCVRGYGGAYAGIELCGNKDAPATGATFSARSPDAAEGPNCAVMIARDGVRSSWLTLWPDGKITQDSKTADIFPTYAVGDKYVRFSNGVQICWGGGAYHSSGTVATFDAAFKDAGYSVLPVSSYDTNAPSANTQSFGYGSKTTSSFVIKPSNSSVFEWIAVGRWK